MEGAAEGAGEANGGWRRGHTFVATVATLLTLLLRRAPRFSNTRTRCLRITNKEEKVVRSKLQAPRCVEVWRVGGCKAMCAGGGEGEERGEGGAQQAAGTQVCVVVKEGGTWRRGGGGGAKQCVQEVGKGRREEKVVRSKLQASRCVEV